MCLFPDETIRRAVELSDARRAFEAKRWKGKPADRARQAKLFADLDWKRDQQALFDVNAPADEPVDATAEELGEEPITIRLNADRQWRSSAGPRQTKAAQEAIARLRLRGKAKIEVTDNGRSEVVDLSGDQSRQSILAEHAIGQKFAWTITAENYCQIVEAFDTAARGLKLQEVDRRTTPEERAAHQAASEKYRAECEERVRKTRQIQDEIMAKRPPKAAALIVAELNEDASDLMTDYHGHKTTRRVAIGWRTGKRESFKQLRAAAATFPETAHLGPGRDVWYVTQQDENGQHRPIDADGRFAYYGSRAEFTTEAEAVAFIRSNYLAHAQTHCESVEHRENWSMGAGNYLKAGSDDSTGWRVRSYSLDYSFASENLEDALSIPADAEQVTTD